ncbi:MAG: sulfotransferase [Anaerolineae bacterium]|nr:sulfotransferase [Anaerolineae bacterium]
MTTVDFLGIGAQKAATTWLWRNLRQHPDVWLPPRKELHYFDRSVTYPSPSHLASTRLPRRLFGREKHNARFRRLFARELGGALYHRDWPRVRWTLRYYLGRYDDCWYRSLFVAGEGKVKGEITPSYSILEETDVAHIADLFPDLKVILILRNPIERAWSHVRFAWTKARFDVIDDLERVEGFIDAPDQSLRSDYVRTIGIWTRCFSPQQLHIGFYDHVLQRPRQLILDILQFLGVDGARLPDSEMLRRRVNVSRGMEIPPEIQVYLAQKYHPQLEQLSDLVGGCAVNWLQAAGEILQADAQHFQA